MKIGFFVPNLEPLYSVAATSTTTTAVTTQLAHFPTNASNAEAHTPSPAVNKLTTNFKPLPPTAFTPVNVAELSKELVNYPDKLFVDNLINCFTEGFRIGFSGPEFSNDVYNLKSADSFESVITDAITNELMENRIAGPFASPPLANFRTSPIGVVPKKEPNKFRMIMDLSSPKGQSVNDGISDDEASVKFNSFDDAVRLVAQLGQGALLAKLDIKSAFRICPVHPADWHLLGFTFRGFYFVDLCLPFGLRSSVNRFTLLASTLLWILQNNYNIVHSTHYLDDYFLAAPANSNMCEVRMRITREVFARLGIPLAPEKIEGPTSRLTFLGIEIDSETMSLRLPQDKLDDRLGIIDAWSRRRKCQKRELLSLVGKLAFASKVVPSGRIFLRRLIDLSMTVKKLSHHISINYEAREDIRWWAEFLPHWNGRYKILDPTPTFSHTLNIFTDASGRLGFGIYFDGHWISQAWPLDVLDNSIQWKELYPIYLTCLIWKKSFRGKRLLFHCDNQAVVNIWSSQTSKSPSLMALLRKLFFVSAQFEFTVNVQHIPGLDNSIADCLSRLQMEKFFHLAPEADKAQTPIPVEAWLF